MNFALVRRSSLTPSVSFYFIIHVDVTFHLTKKLFIKIYDIK